MPRIVRTPPATTRSPKITIRSGDARDTGLPERHYHAVITSPPYFGLREYGDDDREIGDEASLDEYVAEIVAVGREIRRVLRDDGVFALNLGDAFAPDGSDGLPRGSLLGAPWRAAFALQRDGWILRSAIPWLKLSGMPESVTSRPTVAHEYVFLLVKRMGYFWDADAVRRPQTAISEARATRADRRTKEGREEAHRGRVPTGIHGTRDLSVGRNVRTTDFFADGIEAAAEWVEHARAIATTNGAISDSNGDIAAIVASPIPTGLAHFAMFPPRLVAPLIRAGTSAGGCCARCGTPYRRHVEIEGQQPCRERNRGGRNDGLALPAQWKNGVNPTKRYDLGFRRSCGCPDETPVPCRVLDPFAGSGTTLQAAEALGRDADGVELFEKNVKIAERRLATKLDPETMRPR